MIDQKQIDAWFEEPHVSAVQESANREVLAAAKVFAETVNRCVPDSDEKAQSMGQLRGICIACELAIRNHWPASPISIVN